MFSKVVGAQSHVTEGPIYEVRFAVVYLHNTNDKEKSEIDIKSCLSNKKNYNRFRFCLNRIESSLFCHFFDMVGEAWKMLYLQRGDDRESLRSTAKHNHALV